MNRIKIFDTLDAICSRIFCFQWAYNDISIFEYFFFGIWFLMKKKNLLHTDKIKEI